MLSNGFIHRDYSKKNFLIRETISYKRKRTTFWLDAGPELPFVVGTVPISYLPYLTGTYSNYCRYCTYLLHKNYFPPMRWRSTTFSTFPITPYVCIHFHLLQTFCCSSHRLGTGWRGCTRRIVFVFFAITANDRNICGSIGPEVLEKWIPNNG